MAGQEGSPKKDDGAGGSSKPAPGGDGSSSGSTDAVENLGLENPHDVPGNATVAEQGKGSAPSTGSAAADQGKEVQGSHGIALGTGKEAVASSGSGTADKGKEAGGSHGTALDKGKGVASAVAGDVSAHAGTGVDESKIEQMTALVAQLPPILPAQVPPPAPQAPLAHHKGKKKGNSAGHGGSTRSKTRNKGTNSTAKNQGPRFVPPAAAPQIAPEVLLGAAASGIQQGLHLHLAPLPIPPQPGAARCLRCHIAPQETSLFADHECLCHDCYHIVYADPFLTPCLLCRAQLPPAPHPHPHPH